MKEEKIETKPGDGIRSLKTSSLFRALNFELYIKPHKAVMGVGLTIFLGCLGYITYLRSKYESLGYYAGVNVDGSEQYIKKKSNWD